MQAELTATNERTEALLTGMRLPFHFYSIMRAGLGLQHERPTTTWLLEDFAFAKASFFNKQHFQTSLVHDKRGAQTWEEHVASHLVARPPVLQQRLEVVLLDMGECVCAHSGKRRGGEEGGLHGGQGRRMWGM
jgi:hypothetical protein